MTTLSWCEQTNKPNMHEHEEEKKEMGTKVENELSGNCIRYKGAQTTLFVQSHLVYFLLVST